MSKRKREYHIRVWLHHRKIGDRFTASNISSAIGVATPRFVARFLSWQPEVKKLGHAYKTNSFEWQKIAEVPV